ncbi:MAG: class I SAM-dependent methyltransferase [Oscillospiraceae bacterium]|jgi:predicted O-methyltransferase YrrM|nr:class I SAM-dependent methyltransferase [Oscillospiraceae bacterium]
MKSIKDLPISPDKYDVEILEELPSNVYEYSLMGGENRKFINGLIRLLHPKRILELGVAYGGGTSIILNAIKDFSDCSLISVDKMLTQDKAANDHSTSGICETGFIAKEIFSEFYQNGKAKLFTGCDVSNIIDSFNEKFDFVVLDTAHIHPIETLNFLTVLPHLTDDAVIVVDDVMLHFESFTPTYATRILYSAVVADKLMPDGEDYISQNVVTFQITKDTHKYIDNVFSSLMLPWHMFTDDIDGVEQCIEKNYDPKHLKSFRLARRYNQELLLHQFRGLRNEWFENTFNYLYNKSQKFAYVNLIERIKNKFAPIENKDIYFYGGGSCCKGTIELLKSTGLSSFLPKAIYDRNFERTKEVDGIKTIAPNFSKIDDNAFIIVTLRDMNAAETIVNQIKAEGFNNIGKIQDFEIFV